jgi:hypothetical protein
MDTGIAVPKTKRAEARTRMMRERLTGGIRLL